MHRRSRAASIIPLVCVPALVSPGCTMFHPAQGRVRNAVLNEQVSRGAAAGDVREMLGDPWRVEADGAEESWIYRERWADGIDRWGQIVMGFLTLGLYWFLPPEPEYHEVIFRDGRAAAIIRSGSTPPDPGPKSGATTAVTTDPPGARIEADGFFMGHSPLGLSWKAPAHGRRFFADREHTITARLEAAPHAPEEARIPGGKFVFEVHDRIPPSIHFDLKGSLAPGPVE